MAQFLPVFLDTGSIRVATGSRIIDFMHFPVTGAGSSSYGTLLPDPYLFATTSADITNAVNTTSSSLFQLQTSRRQANYFYVHNSIIGVSTSATTTGVRIGLQTLNSADTSANIKVASTLTAHTIACIGTFSPTTFALPASMAAINTIYPSFVKGLYNNSTASANVSNTVLLQPETNNTVTARSGSMSYNKFIGYRSDLLDRTFDVGTGFSAEALGVKIQPDQKIIVVGSFTSYNGTTQNRITRLNSDGTIDTSFNIGTGFDNAAQSIDLQEDNKIVIGGFFPSYDGVSQNYIVRLNSDGTRDTSFNTGTGFGNSTSIVKIQPDQKILVGGNFTSYDGTTQNYITRLNSDGTIDTSFNIGTGFNSSVETLDLQEDNKIVVAGNFTTYSGSSYTRIIRLNTDGTIDTSFNPGAGIVGGTVSDLKIQKDQKILAVGSFTTYSGSAQNRIVRINANGTKDTTFNVGTSFDFDAYALDIQSDNKILVGGAFDGYSGSAQENIIRLNESGSKDTSFINASIDWTTGQAIRAIAIQSDNKIVAVGSFIRYNGVSRNFIMRLLPSFISNEKSVPLYLSTGSLKQISGSDTISSSFLPVTSSQWFSQSLATNVSNTSNTGYATVFTLTGLITGQRYLANLYLIGSSAAAATGFRMRVTTGSAYRGTLYTPTSTTAPAIQNSADGNNITSITAGTWPTVNVKYLVYGDYTFVKAAQDPQVQILSETNGTAVTAFSGSVIYYRAID